jgi:hypothetical protein
VGIAGAHGLDGAGRGYSFHDPVQERLGRKLDQLTGGNKGCRNCGVLRKFSLVAVIQDPLPVVRGGPEDSFQ